ncbi:hypothetical protein EYF80_050178 [Liparis tanakae]|uniref:Uncharacterized protein n=1 Tax=Liparis tanakae TaxID=230148 RepID=A0A4Z2FEL0_9TELE|nr:hypothetical protein EYF80_050178 [Liparis tanakae]
MAEYVPTGEVKRTGSQAAVCVAVPSAALSEGGTPPCRLPDERASFSRAQLLHRGRRQGVSSDSLASSSSSSPGPVGCLFSSTSPATEKVEQGQRVSLGAEVRQMSPNSPADSTEADANKGGSSTERLAVAVPPPRHSQHDKQDDEDEDDT